MSKYKRKKRQGLREKKDLKKFVLVTAIITMLVLLILYFSFKSIT